MKIDDAVIVLWLITSSLHIILDKRVNEGREDPGPGVLII